MDCEDFTREQVENLNAKVSSMIEYIRILQRKMVLENKEQAFQKAEVALQRLKSIGTELQSVISK